MSTVVRIALFQANTGIDPDKNAVALDRAADQAAEGGAMMLFTPLSHATSSSAMSLTSLYALPRSFVLTRGPLRFSGTLVA